MRPSGAIAIPYGAELAPPGESRSLNAPLFGLYDPRYPRAKSVYQTTPASSTAMRRGRAPFCGNVTSRSAPLSASMCPSLLVPNNATQIEPSGALTIPYGNARPVGTVHTLASRVRGSNRPYMLLCWTVNQTNPLRMSGVCGSRAPAGKEYSSILPVLGSRRPSLPIRWAVYHTPPSGATTIPCGPDAGVGVA